MPDAHDLETRVQLLERALSKLLGTEDFEAFLAEQDPEANNCAVKSNSASNANTESPAPRPPLAAETAQETDTAVQTETAPFGAVKVTNVSSPDSKLRLFADYFHGREDVYATAWRNGDKKGWSPASYGRYDRNNPNLKPLTPKVLEQHLRRDNDLHVGLYPLCKGDTCFLLACDFDDADFRTAARAYAATCRKFGLDPLIELSRSGTGAHVWLFFSEPVPASLARTVGIGLLAKASPKQYFASFDRFFPSQDTLPGKRRGFGNLIALPLAGQHRAEQRTVFVNDDFESADDQFATLTNTTKASIKQLKKIAAALQPDPETQLPQPPTKAELKALNRSGKVRVTHDSRVHINLEGVDATTATALRHLGAIPNPQFYIRQAQRLSTYQTPRLIIRFDEHDGTLTLDRGALDDAIRILKAAGYTVTRRSKTSKPRTVPTEFTGELYPEQRTAVAAMRKHRTGILVAPPGAGKTVMACALIAHRQVPTAIIVPNVELAAQWRDALTTFLKGTEDSPTIGQYGGKAKKLSGDIDIITAQSISRADSRTDFLADYGYVIIDECHRVGAAGLTRVLADLNVRFVTGLTATPFRSDGLDALLPLICGPIRHSMELDRPGPKHYVVQTTEFTFDEPHLYWPDLDNALAANPARNALIAETIARAATRGKNVLVLVKRREHITTLETLLARNHPDLPIPVFTLHGAQQTKDRTATRRSLTTAPRFVLIAMTQIAGEGIDLPALDALVLAAPVAFKGNIIQQIGRVTRDASTSATIFDFHDHRVPALTAAFRKRSRVVRQQGFTPGLSLIDACPIP
ncbi:DEAD/DEAH box helicase [Corynebacterium gottingense]|uniref:DEAD/DEAH box helicase n=1 Tax=Corynebacterium gottingense TaxID=2041036 RepID=A0ABX9UGX9_9CORY|nr:DEAD/DEAH box helicase [Corynebacterium gottingense]RMD17137.1 DEAD/DEAH box helicase [Corynebacterium gottingense]WJZ13601.1 UvrABC system protein B [Corynebacterium gottingense]WJZ15919.1 UvrABC system protein B [Corynebacterium gottingense]